MPRHSTSAVTAPRRRRRHEQRRATPASEARHEVPAHPPEAYARAALGSVRALACDAAPSDRPRCAIRQRLRKPRAAKGMPGRCGSSLGLRRVRKRMLEAHALSSRSSEDSTSGRAPSSFCRSSSQPRRSGQTRRLRVLQRGHAMPVRKGRTKRHRSQRGRAIHGDMLCLAEQPLPARTGIDVGGGDGPQGARVQARHALAFGMRPLPRSGGDGLGKWTGGGATVRNGHEVSQCTVLQKPQRLLAAQSRARAVAAQDSALLRRQASLGRPDQETHGRQSAERPWCEASQTMQHEREGSQVPCADA